MSSMFNLTSSPTLIPVDVNNSTIARSLISSHLSLKISRFSSVKTSLTTRPVLTLCILLTGFLII